MKGTTTQGQVLLRHGCCSRNKHSGAKQRCALVSTEANIIREPSETHLLQQCHLRGHHSPCTRHPGICCTGKVQKLRSGIQVACLECHLGPHQSGQQGRCWHAPTEALQVAISVLQLQQAQKTARLGVKGCSLANMLKAAYMLTVYITKGMQFGQISSVRYTLLTLACLHTSCRLA